MVLEDDLLKGFYEGKKIDVIAKKYTYYLAGQFGGNYHWLGPDVQECHFGVNIKRQEGGKPAIKAEQFARMSVHF